MKSNGCEGLSMSTTRVFTLPVPETILTTSEDKEFFKSLSHGDKKAQDFNRIIS